MPVHVFVYGTLRVGQWYRPLIETYIAASEPAEARGQLYDLGPYPAMIAGNSVVTGELLRLDDPAEAIRVMDDIENYYAPGDPRNEYERVVIRAVAASASDIDCYCYMYARPQELPLIGTPIASGDWLDR